MKPDIRPVVLVLAAWAALVLPADAQEATWAGLWQFTAQDQSRASSAGGGTTFTSCIDPARSVPTDPQLGCRVSGVNRSGPNVTWAMTCTVPQGTFNSKAVAQYRGGTMAGTITTDVPVIGGQMVQQISGRYLGPCNR